MAEGGHEVLQRRRRLCDEAPEGNSFYARGTGAAAVVCGRLGDPSLRGPLGGARGEDRGEERVEAAAAQQVGGVDEARVRQVCEEHRAPLADLRRA